MATDEERAKIIAEYMANDDDNEASGTNNITNTDYGCDETVRSRNGGKPAVHAAAAAAADMDEDDDEDDGVDFDPHAANSDSDNDDYNSNDEEDNDDDDEGTAKDHVVLNGSIHLNDEGRVIYSGTWCLQSELDNELRQLVPNDGRVRKKRPKFKLKSQDACYPVESSQPKTSADGSDGNKNDGANTNGNGKGRKSKSNKVLFDIHRPTLAKEQLPVAAAGAGDGEAVLPTRRTMIFDGFFFEPLPSTTTAAGTDSQNKDNGGKPHHGKKIKERDVEVFFTTVDKNEYSSSVTYRISGRGYNDYGPFVLDGTYDPPLQSTVSNDDKGGGQQQRQHRPCAKVECCKSYGSGGTNKATRSNTSGAVVARSSKRTRNTHHDDDYLCNDDFENKPDHYEVAELCDDAGLSIEELRRKYYGGGGEESGDGGGKVAAKRARLDESDDDECGF